MEKMSVLAIVPARLGSKRLPKKNVMDIAGVPMIEWTLRAAKKCSNIHHIVVSSDDPDVIDIAKSAGVDVPFVRPEHLCTDSASSVDVVLHAIHFYQRKNILFDYIVLLQPTSPLRRAEDIDNAFDVLKSKNADAVVSVSPLSAPFQWSNTLPDDDNMHSFIRPEVESVRSQDLPDFFSVNGAIYIANCKKFVSQKSFFLKDNTYAHRMPLQHSLDIDTQFDFDFADFMLNRLDYS